MSVALALALPALACDFPDEGANTAWRRAVSKVKYLPETEAMAEMQSRDRNVVTRLRSVERVLGNEIAIEQSLLGGAVLVCELELGARGGNFR